jgi:hypothetical protein
MRVEAVAAVRGPGVDGEPVAHDEARPEAGDAAAHDHRVE